jgi:hypothetical protein
MTSLKNAIKNKPKIYQFLTILYRLFKSYTYNKEHFLAGETENEKNVFKNIYTSNYWGSHESISGGGSTLATTKDLRIQLPRIINKYNIKSMLDLPCGDFNWMKEVSLNCEYYGADIVEEIIEFNQQFTRSNVRFIKLDAVNEKIPEFDLIFCKDFLQHLSFSDANKVIENFKKSGSKFLLVTSYPLTLRNYDIKNGDFRALNLLISPYNFENPLEKISESYTEYHHGLEIDKTMYLFKL